MTRQRHVKARGTRHEKDDRDEGADPRHFVLGWDNREKRQVLAKEAGRLRERLDTLDLRVKTVGRELAALRIRQAAAQRAQEVTDFSAIDHVTPRAGGGGAPPREEAA